MSVITQQFHKTDHVFSPRYLRSHHPTGPCLTEFTASGQTRKQLSVWTGSTPTHSSTKDMSWPRTSYLKPNTRAVSSILITRHVKGGSWLKSLEVKSKGNFRGIYMKGLRKKPTSYFNRLAIHVFPKHQCIWTENRGQRSYLKIIKIFTIFGF